MIIVGDFHLKYQEPFWYGQKEILEHLKKAYAGKPLCFTGDVFDTSAPHWVVFSTFANFCSQWQAPIYIVHGNHEYSQVKGSCLSGLQEIPNVKIFFEKAEEVIDGERWLFLPFRYDLKEMKAYGDIEGEWDWCVTHITPTKYQFGEEGVDLKLKAKTVFHGHIHLAETFGNQVMVGVPQTTRNLEQAEHKRIIRVEAGAWYSDPLPVFMEIQDIEYGHFPANKYNYLNVLNAPSSKSVFELYKGYYIRDAGVAYKTSENAVQQQEMGLEGRFKQFLLDSVDVSLSKGAELLVYEYMSKVR